MGIFLNASRTDPLDRQIFGSIVRVLIQQFEEEKPETGIPLGVVARIRNGIIGALLALLSVGFLLVALSLALADVWVVPVWVPLSATGFILAVVSTVLFTYRGAKPKPDTARVASLDERRSR